jgi:hypothetical protein
MAYPQVELFLAMSVFPIFMLPALSRWLVARLLRPRTPGALAPGLAAP